MRKFALSWSNSCWYDFSESYLLRGQAYQAKGEEYLAISDFGTAIRLGGSEVRLKAYTAREINYQRATKQHKKAVADFSSYHRIPEKPTVIAGSLAASLVQLPWSASRALLTVLYTFPADLLGKARWLATKRHYKRGQEFHDRGDFELAIAEYNTALDGDLEHLLFSDPERRDATHPIFLGFSSIRQSDSGGSHVSLAWCYVRRGLSYVGNAEYALAMVDFDSAVGVDSTNLMHWTISECRRIASQQSSGDTSQLPQASRVPRLEALVLRVIKENRGY